MIKISLFDLGLVAGVLSLIAGVLAGIPVLTIGGGVFAAISFAAGLVNAGKSLRTRHARRSALRAEQEAAHQQRLREFDA